MTKKGIAGVFAAVAVLGTGAVAMQTADSTYTAEGDSAAVAVESSAAAGPLSLRVDLSARELYLERGGDVVGTYPVTVGTSAHPTPRGRFGMRRIIWNPRWVPPDEEWAKNRKARGPGDPKNPMGKVKIFFNEPDYYIHGTLATKELGTAASHGCIRMRNADVTEVGRIIMEAGGATVEPGFFRSIVNRIRSTREVRLKNAVTLEITA